MRKISLWARHHRPSAISSLIVIKLLLAALAYYIGSALLDLSIHIPFFVLLSAMAVFLLAALLYPSRRQYSGSKKQRYTWQKSCDFTIAACCFLMIASLVNSNGAVSGITDSFASQVTTVKTPTAEEILASLKYRDKSTLTRQEKRILKDEFKKQLKLYAVAKVTGNKDGAGKALLITLTIIGAIGLLYLVAALACSLSCNGSDFAAVVVALLGTAAIVWLVIVLIKRITRGPKMKNKTEPGN